MLNLGLAAKLATDLLLLKFYGRLFSYRKFTSSLCSSCFSDFFEFASKLTRSNHFSFFVKIIREWNDLPANVVEIGNLRRFKIALKSYMRIS